MSAATAVGCTSVSVDVGCYKVYVHILRIYVTT